MSFAFYVFCDVKIYCVRVNLPKNIDRQHSVRERERKGAVIMYLTPLPSSLPLQYYVSRRVRKYESILPLRWKENHSTMTKELMMASRWGPICFIAGRDCSSIRNKRKEKKSLPSLVVFDVVVVGEQTIINMQWKWEFILICSVNGSKKVPFWVPSTAAPARRYK